MGEYEASGVGVPVSQAPVLTTAGLRFSCPNAFPGIDEEWDLFQYKCKAYMSLSHSKFNDIFEKAQSSGSKTVEFDFEDKHVEILEQLFCQFENRLNCFL